VIDSLSIQRKSELAEIDENLIRNEIFYLDQDDMYKRRKEIYELLHPETKNGGDRKSKDKISFQNLETDNDISKSEPDDQENPDDNDTLPDPPAPSFVTDTAAI